MKIALFAIFCTLAYGALGLTKAVQVEHALSGNYVTKQVVYDSKLVKIEGMFVAQKMWFGNGKFKMWTDQKQFTGTYELDDSKDPRWITLQYDGDTPKPFQGTSFRGVYGIEDDKLKIVLNVERRPKTLSSERHSLNTMYVFEKVTEEKKEAK